MTPDMVWMVGVVGVYIFVALVLACIFAVFERDSAIPIAFGWPFLVVLLAIALIVAAPLLLSEWVGERAARKARTDA